MDNRKVSFIQKLFGSDPRQAFRFAAADNDLDPNIVEWAEKLFRATKRIDILPLTGKTQGYIIILNQGFSLWFFRQGDGYVYDGFEIGPYGRGQLDPDDVKEVQS